MGSPLERRRGHGRRATDALGVPALRGLLHDLAHEISTLSSLVEAIRGDVAQAEDSSYRLELLSLEMGRLLDLVNQGLNGVVTAADVTAVNVREMLSQIAHLAGVSHPAEIHVIPGQEVAIHVNCTLLWRVLCNVVDNAARAAGTSGRVTLAVRRDAGAIIEVADNGPGFGAGPPGSASLGLDIVATLLESCGGSLEVSSPPAGGTTVRVKVGQITGAPARSGPGW